MKDLISYRMSQARNRMMMVVNETAQAYDLPAFIMEEILADVLGECRQQAKVELLRDIEQHTENEAKDGQGVQQDNMGE